MRTYLFLILAGGLLAGGCGTDSNPVEASNYNSLSVAGMIKDYGNFSKVYAITDTLGSRIETEIKADGSFELIIPPPNDSQLEEYKSANYFSAVNGDSTILIDSLQIADRTMKYKQYYFSAESKSRITYSVKLTLAKIANPEANAAEGDFFITYYFFDSETTIGGYYKLRIATADLSHEWVTKFNIRTKPGWNKIMTQLKTDKNNKLFYEATNIEEEKGDWIIGARGKFLYMPWIF